MRFTSAVRGSARACERKRDATEVVNIPTETAVTQSRLASKLEGTLVKTIAMRLVLSWYEANIECDMRTRPTTLMVERFFEILKEQVSQA